MPGGDRTGPDGMGPMTGRAAGYCAGYPVSGFMNQARGKGGGGYGRGRGGGGGWRHRHWYKVTGMTRWQRAWMGEPACTPTFTASLGHSVDKEQKLETLKQQVKYFEQALDDLLNRINEIESPEEGKRTT